MDSRNNEKKIEEENLEKVSGAEKNTNEGFIPPEYAKCKRCGKPALLVYAHKGVKLCQNCTIAEGFIQTGKML